MVDVSGSASSLHFSIKARPNCSFSPADTLCAFFSVALTTLIFAFGFVLIGAWPVLLFAGMELVLLGLCLYRVWWHSNDFERLILHDDKVIVESHEPGCDRHIELNGYWARLIVDRMPDGTCQRLALRSHGREIDFGRHLSSSERLEVAHQLKPRLRGFMS